MLCLIVFSLLSKELTFTFYSISYSSICSFSARDMEVAPAKVSELFSFVFNLSRLSYKLASVLPEQHSNFVQSFQRFCCFEYFPFVDVLGD